MENDTKIKEYPVIIGIEIDEMGEYPIVENIWMSEEDAEKNLEWGDEDKTIYKPKTLGL